MIQKKNISCHSTFKLLLLQLPPARIYASENIELGWSRWTLANNFGNPGFVRKCRRWLSREKYLSLIYYVKSGFIVILYLWLKLFVMAANQAWSPWERLSGLGCWEATNLLLAMSVNRWTRQYKLFTAL